MGAGAKRSGLIKMASRPHERKGPGVKSAGAIKKAGKKKLKLKLATKASAGTPAFAAAAAAATGEAASDNMFGMALTTPALNPFGSSAVVAPAQPAVEQPPAFADADKNDLFRRVITSGCSDAKLHPADAHRQHCETLRRRKAERKAEKDARWITKAPRPLRTGNA